MFGPNRYLAVAGAVALLGAGGYVWALKASVATLRAEKAVLSAELATCTARTTNIIEDRTSDATIDAIPDADLGDVPDRWLRKK